MKHWLVGVAINIVGSLMVNFGTNMMKSSHNNNDKEKANDDIYNNLHGCCKYERKDH
jgi:hypothetical protein